MSYNSNSEWNCKPLGELCRIELGKTPARGDEAMWDRSKITDNVWLSIADLPNSTHAVAYDSKEYISDAALTGMRIIPAGTLMVSFKLTLGRLAVAGRDLFSNEAIASLHDVNEDLVDNTFLYWSLYHFDWEKAAEGDQKVKGKTLNKAKLKQIPVPLPPLDEQKRIVSILDHAFEGLDRARENAEANLENARELNESIKASVLGQTSIDAKRVKLSEVSDITSSLVDPKQMEYRHLPHIGAGNMVTLSDDLTEVKTAAEENLISQKYLYDETMVLYSKIRPYLRKAARPCFGGLCSADVYPLKPAVGVLDRDFLFYILLSDDFTKYAEAGSARAGMPKVNRKHLFNYEFSLPSISDQQDMVVAIDRTKGHIAELINECQRKLSELEDLRQSLLQKAFSGELT